MDATLRAWWEQRKKGRPAPLVVPYLSGLLEAQEEGEGCLVCLRMILSRVLDLESRAAVLLNQIRKERGAAPPPKAAS
jgi:hypothetical protein